MHKINWQTIKDMAVCAAAVAAAMALMANVGIQIVDMPKMPPKAMSAQYVASLRHEAERRWVISSRGEPESCNVCKK